MSEPMALLDQIVLRDLEEQIGRDNVLKVLEKVVTEAAQRWQELLVAQGTGDATAMQRHAHSLSSIFRSVGLMPAGEAFLATEVQLRAGNDIDPLRMQELEGLVLGSLAAVNEQVGGD